MSDLLRALPSVAERSSTLPRPGPNILTTSRARSTSDGDHDASSSSDSSASTADSINTLRPSAGESFTPSALYPPIAWHRFFAQELFLPATTRSGAPALYHAYLTPPADPLKGPLYICHHGAGSSAMSFAPFAAAVHRLQPHAGILSLSAREHGSVISSPVPGRGIVAADSPVADFSTATLVADALAIIDATRQRQGWSALPPALLVGHSLGGAVATRIAASGALGSGLVGFQVLDVVEGSAIEALSHMRAYLTARPGRFASVDEAVEWHVRSRVVRDRASAGVTVPALLRRVDGDGGGWGWRTELGRTEPWWEEWFVGLSGAFLAGRAAKALVLAGTDRLDKELMVGQMQGKFQLTVIPEAGHFVQEDVPEKMAQLAIEFFKRNDRSALVLPPKVSDLVAQGKKV